MRVSRVVGAIAAAGAAALAVRAAMRAFARSRCDGCVVFITGGSRGLGLALAREFAERGAHLAICGRDAAALDDAARSLRAQGARVVPLACDVRDLGSVRAAFARAIEAYGRIDVLVNNAGTIAVGPMEAMTYDDYRDAMDTHFWAAYNTVETVLPIFERQGGGRIANVVSIGGKVSVPHLLPYSVSKFALAGYSEGLRSSLGARNVRVTTIYPGLMRTGSPRNAWFKGRHKNEYAWFSLSDALPGLSIAAASAARAIADATLRGDAEATLSLPAQMLAFAHGAFPSVTARILEVAARLLPSPGGVETLRMRGSESATPVSESPLSALGKRAEREYNQRR